jgi:mono/diheme cytochrome c family protein
MKYVCLVAIMLTCFSAATLAADISNGRDIALRQCAACHSVTRPQSREVADAPPFEVIGRKNSFDPGLLAFALLDPHPKMNFALTRREAADVAAYISSLAK